MKQIIYREMGNPSDVLKIEEKTSRALENGEVRVAVLATPIHPSNLLKISGQYGIKPTFPAIPGTEGVGSGERRLSADMQAGVVSVEGDTFHSGMYAAAKWMTEKGGILEWFKKLRASGYSISVVGHSLGGAVH